ncbi:MAG: hypothetical protein ACP5N7_05310 [Candidatus Pacearchaeota archaeon]
MGLLIADSVLFRCGLTVSNFYVSLRGQIKNIDKINENETTFYRIYYNIYYFSNKQAYDNENPYFEMEAKTIDITEQQLNNNLFSLIYNNISASYQSFQNV